MTSNASQASSETPSNPALSSNSPVQWAQHEKLLRVLDLFRARDLWEPLLEVLRAEQDYHLRAAVLYSNEPREARDFHAHVAQWLDLVVKGAFENYHLQAEQALQPPQPVPEGDPWMAPDSGGQASE